MLKDCNSSLCKELEVGQQQNQDILAELREVRAGQLVIIDTMKQRRPTPSISPANYGRVLVQKTSSFGLYTTFQGEDGGEPALDSDTLEKLEDCRTEHQLVALLATPLEGIFDDSVCLVNSEAYGWLKTSEFKEYDQKPDMFLCHEAIYTEKPAFQTKNEIPERKADHKFGVLSDWALRDCLAATLEAKLKIEHQAIGEAANYGNHIVWGDNAPPFSKIVLFDKKKFLLMEVSPGAHKITESKWATPGSKKLLRDFPLYQNPWTKLVTGACQKWNLKVARFEGSAWLGSGAFGRVFRVKRDGSDKPMALKVVQECNASILSMEKLMLVEAAKHCDFIMPIEMQAEDLNWALLLSHVGSPVGPDRYKDVIKLLASLHGKGFLHGDPRLANVVSFDNKLYWIDLMESRNFTPGLAMVDDMKKLVASILGEDPTKMQQSNALDNYHANGAEPVQAVISYVESKLQGGASI
jgi:hypothetical protein